MRGGLVAVLPLLLAVVAVAAERDAAAAEPALEPGRRQRGRCGSTTT